MACYLIGDIQGCFSALQKLLQTLSFSPSRDVIYPLGDMVNRGRENLAVLRSFVAWGGGVRPVLGNHDFHLLALAHGLQPPYPDDTLDDILHAPDREELLDWVRSQPFARYEHGVLMLHAGVLPQWTVEDCMKQAGFLQTALRQRGIAALYPRLTGKLSCAWDDAADADQRMQLTFLALTRMRFCDDQGRINFANKTNTPQPGQMPWHEVPGRRTKGHMIAHGHWSAQGLVHKEDILGLDTGAVWGGPLTAVEWCTTTQRPLRVVQVHSSSGHTVPQ